jgi:hypothetical protein
MNESEQAIERAHASERAKRAGEQSRECMRERGIQRRAGDSNYVSQRMQLRRQRLIA